MIVKSKTDGNKVPYSVDGYVVTFNDQLSVDVSELQEDYPVHVSVYGDDTGALTLDFSKAKSYVAELDIPAKKYNVVQSLLVFDDSETENREEIPLSMGDVTITLWGGWNE